MSGRFFWRVGLATSVAGGLLFGAGCSTDRQPAPDCPATAADEIGPFYRAAAPVRNKVGEGYFLQGVVRSTRGCEPLPHARIEFWLVNPAGAYDDEHRATVYANNQGRYQFESNRPTDYVGRLPHIHIMVSQPGYETLITQHYPAKGHSRADLDLVLPPAEKK